MLVRATVPNYWLFTLLSPPQDRQPPKGDPGLAHLSPFLIPGLGTQQARALFSLLTRGLRTRSPHAWCPRPTRAGSPPDPQDKACGQQENAGSPGVLNRPWRSRATCGCSPDGLLPDNAAALTNRQRGRWGGPALREPVLASVARGWFAESGDRGLGQ